LTFVCRFIKTGGFQGRPFFFVWLLGDEDVLWSKTGRKDWFGVAGRGVLGGSSIGLCIVNVFLSLSVDS